MIALLFTDACFLFYFKIHIVQVLNWCKVAVPNTVEVFVNICLRNLLILLPLLNMLVPCVFFITLYIVYPCKQKALEEIMLN